MPAPARRQPGSPPSRAGTPESWHGDALLAGGFLVAAILSAALGAIAGVFTEETVEIGWLLLYSVGITAPLALRRRYPNAVVVVIALGYFAGVSAQVPEFYVGFMALFVAMYSVGAWVDDRRRATIVRLAVTAGMFIWLMVVTFQRATAPADDNLSRDGFISPFVAVMLLQFLINIAFFAGAYVLGDRAYAARMQHEALTARTRELEAEREVTAAQAATLERIRIARELHDVVAHHVSAMGVQAGAARTALTRNPEAARGALEGVETSAREALDELRQLLETLRTPGGQAPDSSTVRLDALGDLAAHASDHGLPTAFTVMGATGAVSDLVQVSLYRIAQEALTNARRHAGPGATADVRLRYEPGSVELEVTNTGRVQQSGRAGLGILGMRERAAAVGGTLEARPRPRGGFLVRARVPLDRGIT